MMMKMEAKPSASLDKKLIPRYYKDLGANVRNQGTRSEPLYTIEMNLHDQAHLKFIDYCLPDGKENRKYKTIWSFN
jgi:hypothetical protein